jgi:hypothetical protein
MQPDRTPSRSAREAAEMLAIEALAFIAEESRSLSRFLEASGIPAEQLRVASREPGFLGAVLEHMLGDQRLLVAFTQSAGIKPAEVARAAGLLGGHWERDLP